MKASDCPISLYYYIAIDIRQMMEIKDSTAAGLAQSVERLTAEREVAGSIPGAGPILRVFK